MAKLVSITSPDTRLLLRSPTLEDAVNMTARAHDPLCTQYLPHISHPKTPITIESNERMIKMWNGESNVKSLFLIVVLLPSPDDPTQTEPIPIGDGGLGFLDFEKKKTDGGIMLNSGSVRGKGFAVAGLKMILAYTFEHLRMDVFEFQTMEENAAMRGVIEKKLGLVGNKTEKGDWLYIASREWWEKKKANGEGVRINVELTDPKE